MEDEQNIPERWKEGESRPDSGTSDPAPAPADLPATPAAPRRRGRTPLLIAGAVVLGVLAGTVTGYAIQYDREPTPLPPLAQQKLPEPKPVAPDEATTHKTINANRWHQSDDDLTKVLIGVPSGAKVVQGPGYDTLDSFATTFERPDAALSDFAHDGFRRLATEVWEENDRFTEIRLVQFNTFAGAEEFQKEQSAYMSEKRYAGNSGVSLPGVPADIGHVWVHSELDEEPGYLPQRKSRAIVRRGDIVMDIFYEDQRGRSIPESDVIDLAKRQLERL
ncbi:hypothetical protein [Streptomyces sp. NBC_01006]|uniref:hypothetical protein n=1 Tax=Streptomyces sp. NBC_01006 TaxID=2903716 RepID=UPI00386D4092|nr:hypothetical protein OG509_17595 [Streptomyces sp. NBC_01006]